MPLRVMFDSNIYISYLLNSGGGRGPINQIFQWMFDGEFELVLPERVLDEVVEKVESKPALTSRVSMSEMNALAELLRGVATLVPIGDIVIEAIARDPDDDYVLAYATLERVDVLVSGDKDLLELAEGTVPFKIRSPQGFLDEVVPDRSGHVD